MGMKQIYPEEEMSRELTELEISQKQKIEKLEDQISDLKDQLWAQETENKALKERMEALARERQELTRELKTAVEKAEKMKQEQKDIVRGWQDQMEQIYSLTDPVAMMQERLRKIREMIAEIQG